jgi:sarcosine oxidase subunit gamma
MPEPFRRSPLSHRSALSVEAVRLAEIPFVPKHILRVSPDAGAGPLRDALSLDLPREPLTSIRNDDAAVLWLGPDEWLILGLSADAEATLARALSDAHSQLTAVGDYYTIVEVAGPRARELLMKLTTLDLHPRAFRAGQVAGSLFGRANAWLWLMSGGVDGPVFRLFVRWSLADYLWCVLAESGREWGLPGQTPVKGEVLLQRSVGG